MSKVPLTSAMCFLMGEDLELQKTPYLTTISEVTTKSSI